VRCPYCADDSNRVIDSRLSRDDTEIRRRRECQECGKRFTTRERVEDVLPRVVKRDERREDFDRRKLLASLEKACAKRPVSVDALDRVWFGTEGGVSMYDGKRWVSWTHKDGLGAPNSDNLPPSTNTGLGTRTRHDLSVGREGTATYNPNYVFSILSARDGSVWAGTWGGGVSRWDGKAWTNLTTRDGLAGNIVYSIAEGGDGALWFGTNNGVSRYDGKAFASLGMKEGLLERNVYAVAVAPDGDIWVGTRKGVARIGR